MPKQMNLATLAVAMLLLAACDKPVPMPTAPQADLAKTNATNNPSPLPDTSVPSADSVLAPAATAMKKEAPGTRANATLTRAEQSSTMPVAGQANDHSAPLPAGKGASAP